MKTSKYVGKTFDNGWTCTDFGLANVQGKKAKAPGARNHFYVFERRTSDNKTNKIIRLNSSEAASVYNGKKCVEEILNRRESKKQTRQTRQVKYTNFKDAN